jgi:hypothetical protein
MTSIVVMRSGPEKQERGERLKVIENRRGPLVCRLWQKLPREAERRGYDSCLLIFIVFACCAVESRESGVVSATAAHYAMRQTYNRHSAATVALSQVASCIGTTTCSEEALKTSSLKHPGISEAVEVVTVLASTEKRNPS